ncbi:MAG TPA: zinc ABC transporter substrate-binding protein [Pseudogracilibacillus sp.]|nr:zinc ABC transporter substrate-binding protein [Pseudogracilibacillus sp.]
MKKLIWLSLLSMLALSACQTQQTNKEETEGLHIYASIYPIQYIVEEIADEEANVESIYPPGVDAHTYEPSSKEITKLAKGDAFIYLGKEMESFAETTADTLESQDITLLEIGQKDSLFETETEDHDLDPHIWLDPLRMKKMGEMIKDKLIELDPDQEATFEENYQAFQEEMESIDESFTDTLENKEQKDILVSHAAYGYWEERYGIQQIAISGLSSSDEPSQKELTEIADIAKEKNIQYVIYEASTSNKTAEIIQDSIGADKLSIHSLEVLTEEDIEKDRDYPSIMKDNLDVLDQATSKGGQSDA